MGLRIIAINVNSIVSLHKRNDLEDFIRRQKPDLLLVSETKLTPKHKMAIQGYTIIRRDRKNAIFGGGTAIIIKQGTVYDTVNVPIIDSFTCLEITGIYIRLPAGNRLYILAGYASNLTDTFERELDSLCNALDLRNPRNRYVLAGDLNAKHTAWLNPVNNHRGITLKDWIEANHIEIRCTLLGPSAPTFPRGNSYLDIGIVDARLTDSDEIITSPLETIAYDSDHMAILLRITTDGVQNIDLEQCAENQIKRYKNTDWKRFSTTLVSKCRKISLNTNVNLSNEQIDETIGLLDGCINDTINRVVPKTKTYSSTECYVTPDIRILQRHKNCLVSELFWTHRHKAQIPNPQQAIQLLKSRINNVKTLLKQHFRNSSDAYWRDKIKNISQTDSRNMFPNINRVFRKKAKATIDSLIVHPKDEMLRDAGIEMQRGLETGIMGPEQSVTISNDQDKLCIIGTYFESIHKLSDNVTNLEFENAIKDKIAEFDTLHPAVEVTNFCTAKKSDQLLDTDTQRYFTTFENLKWIFKRLNNKVSAGVDGVPNIVLKHLPPAVIRIYCSIFNNALNNAYFPTAWKKARIVPILKKGKDPSSYMNYRPISLLPNIGKVYEVVINQAIQTHCDNNNVIPDCQFGFRRFHSSVHAIGKFTSDCCWYLNGKQCVGACLIDLEKAFDSVWQTGLFYKMIENRFPPHLIHIVRDMVVDKKFVVATGNCTTNQSYNAKGLLQGTVNAPILFNIFIADILRVAGFNDHPNRRVIAYADDIIIYTNDKRVDVLQQRLQAMYTAIEAELEKWKLKVNTAKCETILIRTPLDKATRNVKKYWRQFGIQSEATGQDIARRTDVKYLGVVIDQYLYFTDHITKKLQMANKAYMLLNRMFHHKHLSAQVKLICYKALIRPLVTYGAPIWFNQSPAYMERMRLLERRVIRACTRMYRKPETEYQHNVSNNAIYDEANLVRIDRFILGLIRDHHQRAIESDNSLIGHLYYPNEPYIRNAMESGHIPPEAFPLMDAEGYIEDSQGIPIIYHVVRRPTDKSVRHQAEGLDRTLIRFNTSMGNVVPAKKTTYWWQQ